MRWSPGGGILEEESCRRNPRGGSLREESWQRNHGEEFLAMAWQWPGHMGKPKMDIEVENMHLKHSEIIFEVPTLTIFEPIFIAKSLKKPNADHTFDSFSWLWPGLAMA